MGQMVSLTGSWMQITAQGWLVYQLTGSKVMLGTVAAVGSLPILLFSVWAGSLADMYPRHRLILMTQFALMILAFVFAWLIWSGRIVPWHILVLSGFSGLALAFDMPARQAFMIEMVGREDLMNAVSLNSSVVNTARVVGPSVAGLLIAHSGTAICFFLNGLSFVAVIAGLLMMRLPDFVAPARPRSAGHHLLEGLRYVAGHRRLLTLFALFTVVGLFGWSYSILLPAYAREVLGASEAGYGALLSSNGLGALVGALTVATYGTRVRPRLLVFGGLWVFTGMLLVLAAVESYAVALVAMAVAGWGMLLYFATTNTLIQMSVSDAMRGRVMGIWAVVFGGMMPLGGLQTGALAEALGVPWALTLGAFICTVAGALTLGFVLRYPEKPEMYRS